MRGGRWWYLAAVMLGVAGNALAAPQVVTSIQPLHALATALMADVGEPQLLVRGGASPHTYQMRPSDAQALAEASILFWIGPELEYFLVSPVASTQGNLQAVALLQSPGVTLLPMRSGGVWGNAEEQHAHQPAAPDPHIWLDVQYAIAISQQMLATLVQTDPSHAPIYQRNAATLLERLQQLHQQLTHRLAALHGQRYVVFHDAYQYLERRYGLDAIGALVLDPEQRPGAKRVAQLQAQIRDSGVRCIFSEPQFQPALLQTLIAGSTAKTASLDPIGADLEPGANAYFQLMERLAAALEGCLRKL